MFSYCWFSLSNLKVHKQQNIKISKKFQRNCKNDEEKRAKKQAHRNWQTVGQSSIKVDTDAPTFFEQLEAEVNQVMNAY